MKKSAAPAKVADSSTARSPGAFIRCIRRATLGLCLGLAWALPSYAQMNVEFNIQGAGIGIHLSSYPNLQRIPGYPVYYAPRELANYFFYDGLYWVYVDDTWYDSRWYNGPWRRVDRDLVPLFMLRVPVRYYRRPPSYFQGWRADAAPRWDQHWGADWAHSRPSWDHWNRRQVPVAAPLPLYQRAYSGARYPMQPQRQEVIRLERERSVPQTTGSRSAPSRSPQAEPPAHRPAQASQPDRGPATRPTGAAPVHGTPSPQVQRPSESQGTAGHARGNDKASRGNGQGSDKDNDRHNSNEKGRGAKDGDPDRR